MTSSFQHLFDPVAKQYRQFRPSYPAALIDFVAGSAQSRQLAWDAGCGSGQAAAALAEHFEQVIATDSSAAQISEAQAHQRVLYRVAPAEAAGLDSDSCDLITAANAVHWFDRQRFYPDAARALKSGGIIAVWCYGPLLADGIAQQKLDRFYTHIDPYWESGPLALVKAKYADLDFPFAEITAPRFCIEEAWPIERMLGYYSSWSSVQTCREATGCDAVAELRGDLQTAGLAGDDCLQVRLPLYLRIGRKA